jgi:CzcA family heavy metal efflux pump
MARPYFGLIVLTTLLAGVFGLLAMFQMPSGIYPEVAFPRIAVIASSPGLAIKDVEAAVTRPVEEAVSVVIGVVRVRSKSIRGASQVDIDFAAGTDMVQALNDVRAKMAEAGAQFPVGTSTMVERQTPSVFPIISFVVTGGRDSAALRDYAYYDLRPRISRIGDVSYVTVQGGDIREILVEVDPRRLVEAGMSIADVADRLGKSHRLKAVGRLDRGQLQYQVLTNTQAVDPQELEQLVFDVRNGQPVRLGSLGRVVVWHEDRSAIVHSGDRDAVALTVFRKLGGNALAISGDLDSVLADARRTAPRGIQIVPVYDQALLVRTSIANVRDAILIGGLFSVVILLLFLKSVRATLLTALAIPLSLVISFLFLRLSGDTLNLMSLGGLAVAIGLIIDDSVVVIENIARHLAEGQTGDEAIDRASREISGAVIGSTLTTILVFLPLAFVRGVTGQFFQSLSLALTVALVVSMVLAGRFLARQRMPSTGPVYRRFADGYERMLRIGMRFPRLAVVLAILAVLPGWWIYRHLETGFMPDLDEGAFVLDYLAPAGTSLLGNDKLARRIEAVLNRTSDIAGYLRRTGTENGLYATESNKGDILVRLKPPGQRRAMEDVFEGLRKELEARVPELKCECVPLVQDQLNDLSGVISPVEVKIFGPDAAELRRLAAEVGKVVEAAGAEDVNDHAYQGNPDLVVRTRSADLARVGLNAQDVENQLATAMYGQIASTLPEQDRITNIRVRYPDDVRYDRRHLAQLPINVAGGSTGDVSSRPRFVLLGQVASLESLRSPGALWRENQQPVITVSGELGTRDLGSVYRELEQRLAKVSFPAGYRWELAGNYRSQQESFLSLLMVLAVASALVFVVLGFQFRSLTLPLLIFLTQPISLTSALAALWLTHTPLNVSSFMGAILLIGLDVKNGIILIEYIGQLHQSGLPLGDAVVRAGRTRFRPILMTSLSTIFGLLPLAFGFGPGAQMQQPLAIAVIGGLVANMLFTRLLIPVGYLVVRGEASVGRVA